MTFKEYLMLMPDTAKGNILSEDSGEESSNSALKLNKIENKEWLQADNNLENPHATEKINTVSYDSDIEAVNKEPASKMPMASLRDSNLVTWDSPNDPKNPQNWTMKRKWTVTIIVSFYTLVSPISSAMISPALPAISEEFDITNRLEAALTLSVFVLAYAVGPLLLGPLSELYGRVIVLQMSTLFYLVWNLACGFAQDKSQLMAFRFMSGIGGSAPLAIGGGVLSDCFQAEQRGRAISVYSLAPLLGPGIGPIAGGFIAQETTWRWCFHSTSIFTAVVQCFGLILLQESYAPKLLAWKRDRLIKETGNAQLHTAYGIPGKTPSGTIQRALKRPFRMLFTQPIVIVLALYTAYIYGLLYLMISTFPILWTERYNESAGIGSLNFISMDLGFVLGTQFIVPLNDVVYRRLKKRNNGVGRPEFRVPIMVPAALLVPIGLFWYGWSAQAKMHWIMPNIGAGMFCMGTVVGFQCIETYIVDAYTRYAASALAAATVLRSLCGFGFPLFAPAMFEALDFGWGNSLLAFVGIVLGVPAPFMLWKFGQLLRSKSQFAAGN